MHPDRFLPRGPSVSSSSHDSSATRPVRRATSRVKHAAAPIAVAGVVALSATGLGLSPAPAAAADVVQHRLVAEGFLSAADVTGAFDARTGAAVARWQAARGLAAHGLVDVVTAEELLGTGSTQVPRRKIPR
jgi:peptidoglycan hydrolase-like protein with peptidoglycan-binding domain